MKTPAGDTIVENSYVGSVEVKKSEGRGLGLFTTKNVKAGELLVCEKAFSYAYEGENTKILEDFSWIPAIANILTNRITSGTKVSLLEETVQKLRRNLSLLPCITDLYHGSYVPAEKSKEDIIDTYVSCQTYISTLFHGRLLIYKPSCPRCYCCCSPYASASDVCLLLLYPQEGTFVYSIFLFVLTLRFGEKLMSYIHVLCFELSLWRQQRCCFG